MDNHLQALAKNGLCWAGWREPCRGDTTCRGGLWSSKVSDQGAVNDLAIHIPGQVTRHYYSPTFRVNRGTEKTARKTAQKTVSTTLQRYQACGRTQLLAQKLCLASAGAPAALQATTASKNHHTWKISARSGGTAECPYKKYDNTIPSPVLPAT